MKKIHIQHMRALCVLVLSLGTLSCCISTRSSLSMNSTSSRHLGNLQTEQDNNLLDINNSFSQHLPNSEQEQDGNNSSFQRTRFSWIMSPIISILQPVAAIRRESLIDIAGELVLACTATYYASYYIGDHIAYYVGYAHGYIQTSLENFY
ncbi:MULTISPECIES: hypothetical protein [unclassified Candidatus Cardinium]|uniref:hypothetical protein n=1 Tax=unclassified Candidatus Cardinium TaxID=2641185 RepID=UPI001FB36F54|nr:MULTISPECIES: hypothetical protein [unclassified Candidatus Cardinium]